MNFWGSTPPKWGARTLVARPHQWILDSPLQNASVIENLADLSWSTVDILRTAKLYSILVDDEKMIQLLEAIHL